MPQCVQAAPSAPPQSARWYLLRHAQPRIAKGICYGQLNVPADTAATQTAAAAFAAHFKAEHAGHAHTVRLQCSPLQRCQQLAQALLPMLAAHGLAASACQTDATLTEIDFGHWEGRPWNSIAMQEWEGWQADFRHYHPGGGESNTQFLRRVHLAACATATWLQQDARHLAIWLTHAGVMRGLHWLRQHGNVYPASASEWPLDGACPCGQWLALDEAAIQSFLS